MPSKNGRFGKYGGRFVPETVMPALAELEDFYAMVKQDPAFRLNFTIILKSMQGGRPGSILRLT